MLLNVSTFFQDKTLTIKDRSTPYHIKNVWNSCVSRKKIVPLQPKKESQK